MAHICPECGAQYPEDIDCQSIFDRFLALEFTDPGYGAVHFLTVACFMVQHGRYSDEGLAWVRQNLRAYLVDGLPIDEVRRRASRSASPEHRSWKVIRQPDSPAASKIDWTMTIADVAYGYTNAETYRELVQRWAVTTLEQLEAAG